MKIDTSPRYYFAYNQIFNHGFTFALVQDGRYLHTPFMCKNYLQDIFWTEMTGKPSKIFGLEWTKGMLNLTQDTIDLALHGGRLDLAPHAPHLQHFLRTFETALKIPVCDVLTTEDAKIIVLRFHRAWLTHGPMMSALSTLVRLAGAYQAPEEVSEYLVRQYNDKVMSRSGSILREVSPKYMLVELQRFQFKTYPRVLALLQGRKCPGTWTDFSDCSSAHNNGIMEFENFPEVKTQGSGSVRKILDKPSGVW